MKKSDIIRVIATDAEITKVQAEKALNSIVNTIVDEVVKNWEIRVSWLWTFKKVHREAKIARNPKTGETIKVPAKNVVRFKASKSFKDAVT